MKINHITILSCHFTFLLFVIHQGVLAAISSHEGWIYVLSFVSSWGSLEILQGIPNGSKLSKNIESKQSENLFKYIKSNDSATFVLKPATRSQVLMCLEHLNNCKARGPYKISTNLVKDAVNFISHSFTFIYNSSMKNCIFPIIGKSLG